MVSLNFGGFQKQKNSEKEGTDDGAASRLVKVKTKYKDVDDYIATYEPLIFEEAKSQIIKQKEDEEGIFISTFLYLFAIFLSVDYYFSSSSSGRGTDP